MHVLTIDVPHLGNRTHLLHDGRIGIVIDPPRDPEAVEKAAAEAGVGLVAVAETHIHNDYVSGGLCLSKRHGAQYLVAAEEEVEFARIGVRDNETLAFGDIDLRVIATPGHTALHLSFLATDATAGSSPAAALFSGGSLLHGTVGRTDLIEPSLTHSADAGAVADGPTARGPAGRDLAVPDTRLRPVLCRCGHSWIVPGERAYGIGHTREGRAEVLERDVVAAVEHVSTIPTVSARTGEQVA